MERYDSAAAAHYAAYRPPLHALVLRRVFGEDARGRGAPFESGLDVGCGTGVSTLELAAYCERVVGVDPSRAMLERATPAEAVTYRRGSGDALPLPDASVDVATFAGSLHYADSDATRAELRRVCRAGALVVVYDFEILVAPVLRQLEVTPAAGASDYDHRANLSGAPGFAEQTVEQEQVDVPMAPAELAHVLLSDSHRLDRIARRVGAEDPFAPLVETLREVASPAAIRADLYWATYVAV